jgi:Tol biopolymer transport system component
MRMGSGKKQGDDSIEPSPLARTVPTRPSDAPRESIESADTLLDSPSVEPAAIEIGSVLGGRYRIVGELGHGGEGVVYRALDLRADAVVALKLLRRDPALVGRLRRELHMARKVTHPNAVRIYDLVELPGRFGLTMELVEGETLDRRLSRAGKMTASEVVTLALDLARALAAAHAAGVTHRDLKPANVILRPHGNGATITDFGIARLHGSADTAPLTQPGTRLMQLTSEGALVGTPLYMSPEQLDGLADIGPAADVFAFGLVVREAATCEQLHANVETIGALREARRSGALVHLLELRPDFPLAFAQIIDRCLAVRPGDRFEDGRALLQALEPTVGVATPSAGASARRALVRPLLLSGALALAAGAALAAGIGVYRARHRTAAAPALPASAPAPPAAAAPRVSAAHRITFGETCEEFPSFTNDGSKIVYDGTVGANSFIYLMDLRDGTSRAVTHVDEGWDYAPSLSPDGRSVAFLRSSAGSVATYVAPLDGGTPPRFIATGSTRPAWSLDGRSVWGGNREHPSRVDVATGQVLESLPETVGSMAGRVQDLGGNRILVLSPEVSHPRHAEGALVLYDESRQKRALLSAPLAEVMVVVADRGYALVSRSDPADNELVRVPLDGTPPVAPAIAGIHATNGFSLSPDGKHVVWSTCRTQTRLARIGKDGHVTLMPQTGDWSEEHLVAVPDTNRVVVLSTRTGRRQPWVLDLDGIVPDRMISVGDTEPHSIAVSPDGRWLALGIFGKGILLVPMEGNAPARTLIDDPLALLPSFRHASDEVLFTRQRADGGREVMTISTSGGAPRSVLGRGSRTAVASPTDDTVVFLAGDSDDAITPSVLDPTGKVRVLSPELAAQRYDAPAISSDGRRVAIRRREQQVIEVDLASGHVLRKTDFDDDLGPLAYTKDGLIVVQMPWVGDLWLGEIEGPP